MAIGHRKENIIFMVNKFIVLTNIQMIDNRKQKNFSNKNKNSKKIKINIMHF